MKRKDRGLDADWSVAERWADYEGERRANLLRLACIGLFYGIELVNRHGLSLGFLHFQRVESVDASFHTAVTALAGAWAVSAACVLTLMRERVFPAWLKYASTALDFAFLTAVLAVGDGPRSPLLAAYFPLIALSALRFSLPLIRFATVAAILSYAVLLFVAIRYRPALVVPRYFELLFVASLGVVGMLSGQVVRRARSLAEYYAARLARRGGEA